MISIVVPTYREAENLPLLAQAVSDAFDGLQDDYELLFIDDDSRDGSEAICARMSERYPVRMVVRKGERGLATAVIRGIALSSGEIIVVMDADLSHPPSVISAMLEELESGRSDFVLGSRYVDHGSVPDDWGVFRKLNSSIAPQGRRRPWRLLEVRRPR